MYILLALLTEFISCTISANILFNSGIDSILLLAKKGYKFDVEKLHEANITEKLKDLESSKKLINVLLFLLPGINIVTSVIRNFKMRNDVLHSEEMKKVIVPMSEQEKVEFARMKSKMEKLSYISYTVHKTEDSEFVGVVGDRALIIDHGLVTIFNDKLVQLAYTYDEVKELSKVTNNSYRLGLLEGIPTAIIGFPNEDMNIKRIVFKTENYQKTHIFEEVDDDKLKNRKFIIYPYSGNLEAIDKIVDKIIKNRNNYISDYISDEELMKYMKNEEQIKEEEKQKVYSIRYK